MRPDRFDEIVHQQMSMCNDLLAVKGVEYSTVEDKLHNFVVAAELQQVSVVRALAGMMAKHTISIYDMIPNAYEWSMAQWNEKITDHINYLLLLKAALIDHQDGLPSEPMPASVHAQIREAYTHNA
jgi:hypothetical protein